MTEHFLVPADLWTELFTYIAARVDVRDGGDGRQLPNSAMTLYDRMEREAKLARPEGGRISPDMALLERCREICMRVSHEAEEAAKAKEATDYVAGYQDACVDVDEEIRELMRETGGIDIDVLISNVVTAARASGHARGRGENDSALDKAEDEAVRALRNTLLPQQEQPCGYCNQIGRHIKNCPATWKTIVSDSDAAGNEDQK